MTAPSKREREGLLRVLVAEWHLSAEMGWNRVLSVHESRVVLAALTACEEERERLREALAAYRSAIRSGERESEKLRSVGDDALDIDVDCNVFPATPGDSP